MAAPERIEICVTPLSSLYGLLPRAHTYALVLALFAPLPQGWLFRAALATFTARTAVVAVDAAVLLARLQRQPAPSPLPLPLDVLPVAELLALAAIVAVWLLVCSDRMARSSARPLVVAWAAVVAIGTVLAFVCLKLLGRAVTLTFEAGTACPAGSVSMSRLDVLGAEETLGAGIGLVGDKIGWFLVRVGVVGVLFAALAFLACMVPTNLKSRNSDAMGGMGSLQSELVEQQTRSSYGERVGHVLAYLFVLAMPALAVFVAVSAEQRLLGAVGSPVPVVEGIHSVDQWSVWAATGVVLLATLINAAREQTGLGSAGGAVVESSSEVFKV